MSEIDDIKSLELSVYYLEADSAAFYDGLYMAKREAGLLESKPLPKSRHKTDEEKLAEIVAMPSDKRHLLLLCDLRSHYEAAKSGKSSWTFEREFLALKRYMKIHRWDKNFIASYFGVSFGAMTQLYFQCANQNKNQLQ